MKRNRAVLAFMVLFIHVVSCKGQVTKTQAKNKKNNHIEALKGDFNKAQGKDSVRYAKMFFDAFPTDFVSFNSIYGYSDKAGPMPLYSLYEKHIGLFCKINSNQPTTEHFSKLIKLGINGHWDADAVNALQDCILSHVNETPGLTVTLLKRFKEKEIRSFWRFLFDGPHPDDKEVKKQYDVLYKSIGLIDKSTANLMQNEYMKLVKGSSKE
jgi:hypothetical protein